MTYWINITKEQFDAAYDKHLPSAWVKFAYVGNDVKSIG